MASGLLHNKGNALLRRLQGHPSPLMCCPNRSPHLSFVKWEYKASASFIDFPYESVRL